ncbi:MAG: HEAT repeat domain-containing protein [Candidatus Limnocylindrales bacterium]
MGLFGPPDVAKLKAKGDVPGLIKALGYDADPSVRRDAAAALGELGDPRAVEPLGLALRNPNWEHDWRDSGAAVDALGRLGAPAVGTLISLFGYHSQVVRIGAAEALGAIGRPAVQPLIALMGDADLETRELAAQVLTAIGDDAIQPLIEALNDPAIGRRVRAAKVLGDIGDLRAVEPLARALKDVHAGVRQAAAKSLGILPDNRVVGPLIAALGDSDPAVRRTAALALGEMGDSHAVATLLPELREPEWRHAVDCLVKVGEPAAAPLLSTLADSLARGDKAAMVDELRETVSGALGRIGYPVEVASLLTRLFAPDPTARADAAAVLVRLYESGSLDPRSQALFLAVRPTIDQADEDGRFDGDGPDADRGIGAISRY